MAQASLSGSELGADLSAWLAKITAQLSGLTALSRAVDITICGIQCILDCMAENSIPASQQQASITSITVSLLLALSIMIAITWTASALKLKNVRMDIRPCFECHRALTLTKQ